MNWLPVGKVTRTHGLKGELKFRPFVTDPGIIQNLGRVRLAGEDAPEEGRECHVQGVRGHFSRIIIKFRECQSVDEAQTLAGLTVYAEAGDFPPLPPGEYYWFEVEGLDVFDEDGVAYGKVEEIMETGSNDVYVVRDGRREILLPMIESVVKTVDLEAGKLIFRKVEGLLDGD
ncbi:MAG: 16S rRNA processing protein RimM [Nitrospinae bacterium CG11_big_fil_rev_8_21_14_0_20_56_8]|nr:MAG: 16S rRNA processing protein RimM [Nitrospinae bacterium CG11_big_fil_rev_8_21_14_0_20_56_8]